MIDRTKIYRHIVENFGWSVILLGWRSKVPTKGESPKFRAMDRRTIESVADWSGNLGIMGGRVSGIVIVDLDSDRSVEWARNTLCETPLIQTTHKGEHWFYRLPEGLEVRPRVKIEVPGVDGLEVDIRGEESYVVGPWSVHPSGAVYQPKSDWTSLSIVDVPELPKILYPPAVTVDPRRIMSIVTKRPPMGGERQRIETRLRAYLDKCQPSVKGQGGQQTMFSTICRVLDIGWGDRSIIARCVGDWDARNSSPPWGQSAIEKMVDRCLERFWTGACSPLQHYEEKITFFTPSILRIEEFINNGNHQTTVAKHTATNPFEDNRRTIQGDTGAARDGSPPRFVSNLSSLLGQIPGANPARVERASLPIHGDDCPSWVS